MKILKMLFLVVFIVGVVQVNLSALVYSRIEGTIVDEETKVPLEDAYVLLYQCQEDSPCRKYRYEFTNQQGYFKFDQLITSNYFLLIVKEGYVPIGPFGYVVDSLPQRFRALVRGGEYSHPQAPDLNTLDSELAETFHLKEGEIKHFKYKLEKEAVLVFNISRKTPGGIEPIDAGIEIAHPYYNTEVREDVDDGTYRSAFLVEGMVDITIYTDGYTETTLKNILLEKGKTRTVNHIVDYTVGQVIHGVVRSKSSGNLLNQVYVEIYNIHGYSTKTDDSGEFWIGGIDPGTYNLVLNRMVYDSGIGKSKIVRKSIQVTILLNEKKDLNIEL